jgi:hypothetical protein
VRPIYHAWNDKLKIARLPLRYFANGHTFFVQRMYAKTSHPPPFVVHMTYQYGDSSAFPYGKRQRMREGRVWQVDPPSYFRDGMYLAVAPEAATLPIDYLPVTAELHRPPPHMPPPSLGPLPGPSPRALSPGPLPGPSPRPTPLRASL